MTSRQIATVIAVVLCCGLVFVLYGEASRARDAGPAAAMGPAAACIQLLSGQVRGRERPKLP